ncbi:O-antigen ligase family protein [Roseateles sp. BYS180W]|uniref:O-antigen ligase family protein n=1 Tax=Roseateles rivi TaxID=3299028 RepID=A0ABW7FUF7_9BURK
MLTQPALALWPGSPQDMARLLQVWLFAAAAAALLLGAWRGGVTRPAGLWALWMLGWGGASVWAAAQPWAAAREAGLFLGMAALALAVRQFMQASPQAARALAWLLVGSSALYGVLYVLVSVLALAQGNFLSEEMAMGYANPRHLNHVQTLLLPVLAALTLQSEQRLARAAQVALALQCVVLSSCQGRATFLSLASVTALLLWQWRFLPARAMLLALRPLLVSALVGVVVAALLYGLWGGLIAHQSYRYAPLSDPSSLGTRWRLCADALMQFSISPILGVGPMHLAANTGLPAAHPHNAYVQLLTEWGIFWALGAGILFLSMARRAYGVLANPATPAGVGEGLALGAAAAFLASLVDACFSGNWVMPQSQTLLAVLLGVLAAQGAAAPAPSRSPAWPARILCGCLLLGLLAQALVTAQEWHPNGPTLHGAPSLAREKLQPRFWVDGNI